MLRRHESHELRDQAALLALLVEQRQGLDQPVDRAFLAGIVDTADRLEYAAGDSGTVVAEGKAYDPRHHDEARRRPSTPATARCACTSPARCSTTWPTATGRPRLPVLLAALVAALVGYLMAQLLSRPFLSWRRRRAARPRPLRPGPASHPGPRGAGDQPGAADQRRAAAGAAGQRAGVRRARLARAAHPADRAPAGAGGPGHARRPPRRRAGERDPRGGPDRGHGRRWPASWWRWPGAARWSPAPTSRCATWPPSAPSPGPTRWPSRTATLTAAVEGAIDTTYTPGPVEHVLDLLLADVLRRGRGPVRLVFEADDEGHLTIRVPAPRRQGDRRRAPTGAHPGARGRHRPRAAGSPATRPEKLGILLPRR